MTTSARSRRPNWIRPRSTPCLPATSDLSGHRVRRVGPGELHHRRGHPGRRRPDSYLTRAVPELLMQHRMGVRNEPGGTRHGRYLAGCSGENQPRFAAVLESVAQEPSFLSALTRLSAEWTGPHRAAQRPRLMAASRRPGPAPARPHAGLATRSVSFCLHDVATGIGRVAPPAAACRADGRPGENPPPA